jgi:hypothetical protein
MLMSPFVLVPPEPAAFVVDPPKPPPAVIVVALTVNVVLPPLPPFVFEPDVPPAPMA